MPIELQSIELNKCYRTECGEVRLVTKIEGGKITFASRGPRYYLDWHETASRRVVPREWFTADAVEEVPYFWERHLKHALA